MLYTQFVFKISRKEDILELNMFPTFLSFTESHPRYVALTGLSFFVMGVVLYGFQYITERTIDTLPTENIVEIQESFPVPTRIDNGPVAPIDFVDDIPLEEGVLFEQSYSLEYPEEKQHSVVFVSSKTAKENYALYTDFMKERNWMILNTHEGEGLFSLYAVKDENTVNVTIHEETIDGNTKTEVSISILKK